ncbi:hypothetical protein ACL02S_15690 [Nocardia sp. 004]|uniref:hypothetical protein n=1 Tax=Nocardia sp. 004 TaxID=3385978 RepID=UPI0039A0FB23
MDRVVGWLDHYQWVIRGRTGPTWFTGVGNRYADCSGSPDEFMPANITAVTTVVAAANHHDENESMQ